MMRNLTLALESHSTFSVDPPLSTSTLPPDYSMPLCQERAGSVIDPPPPPSRSFLDKLPPELYLQILSDDDVYLRPADINSFALTYRAMRGAGQEVLHRNVVCTSVASLKNWVAMKDQYTVKGFESYLKGDNPEAGLDKIAAQVLERARGVIRLEWRPGSPMTLIPIEVFSFPNLVSLGLNCCSFSYTPALAVNLPSLRHFRYHSGRLGAERRSSVAAFVRLVVQSTSTTLYDLHISAQPEDVPLALIPSNILYLTVTKSISSTDAARFTRLRDLECDVHSSTLLLAMLSSLPSLLSEFVIVWVGGPGSGDADEMTQCLEMPCLRNLKKVFLCFYKTSMADVFDGRPLHRFKDARDRRGIKASAYTEAGDDTGDEDEDYRDLIQAHWSF